MPSALRFLSKIVVLVAAASPFYASTIIISQGTTPGAFSQPLNGPGGSNPSAYVNAAWSMGASGFTNVTIQALLLANDGASGDNFNAYLTTTIGTGTSTSVASTNLSINNSSYQLVTLFSAMSLNANTQYFLTLAPTGADSITWGIDDSQPSPGTSGGVTELPAGFCSADGGDCDDTFAPDSSGFTYAAGSPVDALGANPIFAVTAVTGVPEPGSALLLTAVMAMFALSGMLIAYGQRKP